MATRRVKEPRQANTDWLSSHPSNFNVAVALSQLHSFGVQHCASERAFQFRLRHFFTRLDRKVLKSGCRKRREKIPRYVVLEYSPSVGWHMHALLSSHTSKFTAEQLSMIVKLMWLEELGNPTCKGFERRLAWAKPVDAGYAHYMTKHLFGPDASSVFDEVNSVFG